MAPLGWLIRVKGADAEQECRASGPGDWLLDGAGLAPWHWASRCAQPQCLAALAAAGAPLDTADAQGNCAAAWALESGCVQCLAAAAAAGGTLRLGSLARPESRVWLPRRKALWDAAAALGALSQSDLEEAKARLGCAGWPASEAADERRCLEDAAGGDCAEEKGQGAL